MNKEERLAALILYLSKMDDHIGDLWEHHPNYQNTDWIEEMACQRMYLSDAILEASYENGFEPDQYIKDHSYELRHTGRLGELEDREIAILEWFEDHHMDPSVDPNKLNREKYIWWYHNKTKNMSLTESEQFQTDEINRLKTIGNELGLINARKAELENQLRPWNL